jgi:rare lipoprotein A
MSRTGPDLGPGTRGWLRCLAPLALALALLSGCASRAPTRFHGPATQRPYTVGGVTYRPLTSSEGYLEEGVASWYGPGFHGHQTSCGEIYDQYKPTCAHKLLPMHTMVKVTNLRNGRSVELRVNDRGPFVAGRIVDLSLYAAKELDIQGRGTARVRLEVVGAVPGVKPGGDLPGPFYVQVGAFTRQENAERLLPRMLTSGYAGSRILDRDIDGIRYWRVLAGTFPSMDEAERARARLAPTYRGAFVIAQ